MISQAAQVMDGRLGEKIPLILQLGQHPSIQREGLILITLKDCSVCTLIGEISGGD
jgi:hypothetical protein